MKEKETDKSIREFMEMDGTSAKLEEVCGRVEKMFGRKSPQFQRARDLFFYAFEKQLVAFDRMWELTDRNIRTLMDGMKRYFENEQKQKA